MKREKTTILVNRELVESLKELKRKYGVDSLEEVIMILIRNNDRYGKIRALEEAWRELKSESDVERLIEVVKEKRERGRWLRRS